MTNETHYAKPRRRWFRFSLRTLLIVVTVASMPFGWVGWRLKQVRRERATLTSVEKLGGDVSDRSWFSGRVGRVHLDNWQVSDLSPLVELKNLKVLRLASTQMSDLSPLAELKNLKELGLANALLSDLSPLAELKNLEGLWLAKTQVSDLSTLVELKNLERLWLVNMLVSDLSTLAELKNLEWLWLHNTQVSDEQVQELRQALPNCEIHHTSF